MFHPYRYIYEPTGNVVTFYIIYERGDNMSGLVFDENILTNDQLYKYDQFLHSRVTKFTGDGRTLVTYFNICESQTTTSLGLDDLYMHLGKDAPLRYNKIENMVLLGFSPLTPENTQLSQTQVRDYKLNGEAYIIPGTIMPKENDFFIINSINMNHIFRVTEVGQDGLNTDGSYRITYALFSTNPEEIEWVYKQTVDEYVLDMETIDGEDLTPVIGKQDYIHRIDIIKMVNDMIENYSARYYDQTHNCFVYRGNGIALFDLCGNMFMEKNGVMLNDKTNRNVVLNRNKVNDPRIDMLYQKSPYKWIERDAPLRYLDYFKYHLVPGYSYPDSSFARYGSDIQVMIPNDPWCVSDECKPFFNQRAIDILENETDIRRCKECECKKCEKRYKCNRHLNCVRFDYITLIHDFIHGKLTTIEQLNTYIGDQLFDNASALEIYLWSPIVIYIIKYVLKMK